MIKRMLKNCSKARRLIAFLLAAVMVFTCIPDSVTAVASGTQTRATGGVVTVDDPSTLTRPLEIYGENTQNAGKITVGKSVSDEAVQLTSEGETFTFTPEGDNFLVTYSQTAQVMGLSTEIPVPVDAVFVLDTSGSMEDHDRTENMVTAANDAIKELLDANEHSRVAVVAFSSDNYGGGTSGGASANVLSSLAHYDTTSDHLTWVNSDGSANGNGRDYIAGRDQVTVTTGWGNNQQTRTVRAYRHGSYGGTNIQAGIALGAQQLMAESNNPVVTIDGDQITRIPFLVVLSDGQPTYSADEADWYNLDVDSADEQGPGSDSYEGNGFLAALTAAYYKGAITDKYFGAQANEEDRCFVYTIGLNISSLADGDDEELAKLTLDPKTYATGNYASGNPLTTSNWGNTYSYYYYGNAHDDGNNSRANTSHSFRIYWEKYMAATPANFSIRVNSNDTYTIDADSIRATKNYVNGYRTVNGQAVSMGYTGGLIYNDDHFSANGEGSAELEAAFDQLVRTIQLKAISSPTQVTNLADFDGYVHYYDPIGEYMEVKNIHGVVNDGLNFKGKSFAQKLQDFNTTGADTVFDQAVREAIKGRQGLTDEQINQLVAAAVASPNQASYDTTTEAFDNSLVWWGKSYEADSQALDANVDDDAHAKIQYLAPADNDTVEFIENAKANNTVPEGADYVCRSYYYYGTAGGTVAPVDDALLFVVRVQRSLTAPYNETVVVSIPASLLCVEKVLITERNTGSSPTYVATVEKDSAVRFVYEVGLRSDINAQNVASVVSDAYASEKTAHDSQDPALQVGKDNVEVDANGDATYYFYTNDWDRTQTESSHLRAMTKVSYDSAPDNEFYRYQADTPILDANGNPVGGDNPPAGGLYYYKRTYYDWEGASQNTNGTYNATRKEAMIQIRLSGAETGLGRDANGNWYIKAGAYTSSTMLVTGDDVAKSSNNTETSAIVTHPVRTNDYQDSHYTVYLGNNGRLELKADKTKTVGVNVDASAATTITDQDGNVVTVGDVLTYYVKVVNNEGDAATAVVTDNVPVGTKLIDGSISDNGTVDTAGKITWRLSLAKDEVKYVSFQVTVTEAALQGTTGTLQNTASIQINNNPAYNTNTTENPPVGKVVEGENIDISANGQNGIQVGQTLIYHIYWANNEETVSDVIITDIIPTGTSLVAGTESDNGRYDSESNTITWTLSGVQPGASGVVTFKVIVDATAETPIVNDAKIQIGTNGPVIETNPTSVDVLIGDLKLSKVVENGGTGYADKVFTLELATSGSQMGSGYGKLTGTYDVEGSSLADSVTFTDGVATVQIKDGETLTIKNLPAGLTLVVTEKNVPGGYTPNYSTANGQIKVLPNTDESVATVKVTNVYAVNTVDFQLKGSKTLETDDFFAENTFTATVESCNSDWSTTGTIATTAQTTVSSTDKAGDFVFAPRTFTKADIGEHNYLITEFNNSLNGVDYDETQYRMQLVVADNGEGQLTVTPTIWKKAEGESEFTLVAATVETIEGVVTVSGAVAFTNEYQPIETSVTLAGTKTLTNRTLNANEFGFEVIETVNGEETVVSTGQNRADGTIEFRPITYHEAGEHTYTIKEVDGKLPNVAYDTTSYSVTVRVHDNDNDGRLAAEVTYPSGGVVFANIYAPGDASVTLTGTKDLTGRDLADKEFTFEVLDATGAVVSTGQNAADGTITFNPIVIKHDTSKTGSYTETLTYTVKEAIPTGGAKDPYMGYDTKEYTIVINVSYDAVTGLLTATQATGNPTISFENEQYPSSVTVTLHSTKATYLPGTEKEVADLDNSEATFSFSVVNTKTGVEATTGVGAANGDVTFGKLTFTTPGTYTYWIKESNAANVSNGITYDSNIYLMEVVISEKMESSVSYYKLRDGGTAGNLADYTVKMAAAPAFENIYAANGSLNITAKKVLNGPRDLQANEFAFKLVRSDNGGEIDGLAAADGKITFATMYYSMEDLKDLPDGVSSKVITYTMSEVIPSTAKIPGVTYDGRAHTIEVELTNDGEGAIIAKVVKVDGVDFVQPSADAAVAVDTGITFTNTYQATEGVPATMEVGKVLNGRDLEDDEFTFELYYKNGDTESLVTTATNQNGKVSFTRNYLPEAVVFPDGESQVTYDYVIREQAGNLGGVTYDTKAIGVRVTIKNNIDEGKLDLVNVQYYDYENTEPKFVNEYKAEGTFVTPEATKILNGRTMTDDEFSFEVRQLNEDNSVGDTVSVGLSKGDGAVVFTPIGYSDRPGAGQSVVNRYVIAEVAGNLGGVTYTDAKYYLKVVVTDAGVGELTTVSTYHTDIACTSDPIDIENVKFINTYNTANGVAQLAANKKLVGRDMAANEFDFVVKVAGTDTVAAYGDNAAASDGASAGITFTSISYSLADLNGADSKTFEYTISEVKPIEGHLNGVETDEAVYTAKVTVTDNKKGQLIVDPIEYYDASGKKIDAVTFTNNYDPADAKLTLIANKLLKEKELLANEFSFVLKDSEGNIVKDASGKDIIVSNDANGVITFPELIFDAIGDYTYYVEEVQGVNVDVITDEEMQDNYYFDSASFKVVVSVTDDKAGQLHAAAIYSKDNTEVQSISFANMYTPDPITADLSAVISATKDVVGPNGEDIDYPLSGFEFAVKDIYGNDVMTTDANGNPVPVIGTSGADGKITFNNFTFDKADEYRYWISEIPSDKDGITDDSRQWEVHILVKHNPDAADVTDVNGETVEIGKLYVAEIGIYAVERASEEATSPMFVNVYDPAPAKLTITADKLFSGHTLKDHQFTFQLKEGELIIAEAHNDAEGNITFNIDVDTAGEHVYTIKEVVPADAEEWIKYDKNGVATVIVNVVDDNSGQLKINGKAEVTLNSDYTFKNIYVPKATTATITAKKILNGTDLVAGSFTFELVEVDGAGNPVEVPIEVKNDADGNVVFPNIIFTQTHMRDADGNVVDKITKNYTLRELSGDNSNITYDQTVYNVTIEVTDDLVGQLHAVVKYNGNAETPVFVNTYEEPSKPSEPKASFTLTGIKKLLGGTMTEGQFKFLVYNEEGILAGSGTNTADGKIVFTTMTTSKIGKEVLTIVEEKGDDKNIAYDSRKIQVTVESGYVYGELKATVHYPEGGIVFTNTYGNGGAPNTGDDSPIMLYLALLLVFGGSLGGLLLWRKRKSRKTK